MKRLLRHRQTKGAAKRIGPSTLTAPHLDSTWTNQTNEVKETNSMVDIGLHYVALDTNNVPVDSDGGGVPDVLEDINGDGVVNGVESDWTSGSGHGSDDFKQLLTPEYL